jgi:enoyl-CoA hydratase/carnithine racemase
VTYRLIRVADGEPRTRVVSLANAVRKNAIGAEMTSELLDALTSAAADTAVRCVVLQGEGDVFCAGGDFTAMPAAGPSRGDYAELLATLMRYEKPVIAKVRGVAYGGGLGLASACTFVVAADDARFGTPEVNVGLFPMMIMAVLARHVPRRRLLELMLLGRPWTAQEALSAGLVSRVVPGTDVDRTVLELASRIAELSGSTLALGLRAFADQDAMRLDASLPMLRDRLIECLGTADAQEGVAAFLEKRKPVWKEG